MRLRPHLKPQLGPSKLLDNLAAQAHAGPERDPVKAAREADKRMGRKSS